MSLNRLIADAAPEWREPFKRFVETGEADEDFIGLMDRDSACQKAVEEAFELQAGTLKTALLDLGGRGRSTSDELPGDPQESTATETSNVVPHPAVLRNAPRWQPYALAAGFVLAVTCGIALSGLSAVNRDQVLRLAEMGELQDRHAAWARHAEGESDFFRTKVARLERDVEEHVTQLREYERQLGRQRSRLASLQQRNDALQADLRNRSTVVVTASRTEQMLHDVPGGITVLTAEAIEPAPAGTWPPFTAASATSDARSPFSMIDGPPSTSTFAVEPADSRLGGDPQPGQAPEPSTTPPVDRFTPPRIISEGAPIYSDLARRLGVWGEVVVECIVTEAGESEDCKVLKSIPPLDRSALRFARKAEFEPGRNAAGEPQRMAYRLRVSFEPEADRGTLRQSGELKPIYASRRSDRQ